jgi:hypothetical protein
MNNYISRDNYMLFNSGKVLSEPLPSIAPYTLRFLFLDDSKYYNPLNDVFDYGTWTQRSDTIWDWTYNDPIWTLPSNLTSSDTNNNYRSIFSKNGSNRLENVKCKIIDSETSNVTNMRGLFYNMDRLEGVEKIDTSNVTDAASMFRTAVSSAATGVGSVKYVNSTLDFRKVKYYNGTTCHGSLDHLFYTQGYSNAPYRLTTVPTILWPDIETVGYIVNFSYMFTNQRNITNNYAGVVYPTYWQQLQTHSSWTDACYRCGDLGNATAYANIPSDLK